MVCSKEGSIVVGRSPRQVRLRAGIRCIPRLLGWLRAARIRIDDPTKHPEKLVEWVAEGDAILALDGPLHTSDEAEAVQAARKRAWRETAFALVCDVAGGARWARIRRRLGRGTWAEPFEDTRLTALAGQDHVVTETPCHAEDTCSGLIEYQVRALRHDQYEILCPICSDDNRKHEERYRERWKMRRDFRPDDDYSMLTDASDDNEYEDW